MDQERVKVMISEQDERGFITVRVQVLTERSADGTSGTYLDALHQIFPPVKVTK